MKIGIVTHYWLPHRGGVEVLASDQAERLGRRGHDVEVVSSSIGDDVGVSRSSFGEGSLTVRRAAAHDVLGRHGVPWPFPSRALVRAWSALPRWADVTIVHGSSYAHSLVTVDAARRRQKRVMILQSNPHVEYPFAINIAEQAVDRTLGRLAIERADAVVSISRFTAAHVDRIAPRARRHTVIYPGIDTAHWVPPRRSDRERARALLNVSGVVVLTVRRLVERNGVDLLVDGWRRCGLDRLASLLVVGDGPQRRFLEARSRGHRVRFLGSVSDDVVRSAYHAADLFVLPTRSGEGFGLAAAQAMAVGLPVVTTDGGAQTEVVIDGVTGAVVPAEPLAIGGAVGRFARNETERISAGIKGRHRVCDCFTATGSVDRLEAQLYAMLQV